MAIGSAPEQLQGSSRAATDNTGHPKDFKSAFFPIAPKEIPLKRKI